MYQKKFFKTIIFTLIWCLINTNIYATDIGNHMQNYMITDHTMMNNMTNTMLNDMSVNGTMSPFSAHTSNNDILSINSNLLNDLIMPTLTQEILPTTEDSTTQMQMEEINRNLNNMTDMLNKNKTVFMEGYVYKYVPQTEEESPTEDSTTEDTVENEKNDIQQTTEEDTVVIENSTTEENVNIDEVETEKETKSTKSAEVEYYTIINVDNTKEYLQLTTNKKDITFLFNLIAGEDILVEMSGTLIGSMKFEVDYVTILTELPSEIKDKIDEYTNKNTVNEREGLFISMEKKVYFLESETEKIYKISTEQKDVEDLILYLSDKGIKTTVFSIDYTDYINIETLTIETETFNSLTEEQKNDLEIIKYFDISKVFNVKSEITENNEVYSITVEDKVFGLKTSNTKIADIIKEIANTNTKVYIEGNLGRYENYINITYISTEN